MIGVRQFLYTKQMNGVVFLPRLTDLMVDIISLCVWSAVVEVRKTQIPMSLVGMWEWDFSVVFTGIGVSGMQGNANLSYSDEIPAL